MLGTEGLVDYNITLDPPIRTNRRLASMLTAQSGRILSGYEVAQRRIRHYRAYTIAMTNRIFTEW
jgi:hypothetical protein